MVFAVAHTKPCCQGLSVCHPSVPSRGKDSVWHVGDGGTCSLKPERPMSNLEVCHLLDVTHYLGHLTSEMPVSSSVNIMNFK